MNKLQKTNRFFAALILFVALFFIDSIAQNDTNFYQIKSDFYRGYNGEIDTNEAGPINQFIKFEYIYGPKFSPSGSILKAGEAISNWISDYEINGKPTSTLTSDWQSIGPNNIPPGESAKGVGRVNCITLDPVDPNNIIYVGSPFGGVWKTNDGGLNWSNLNTDYQIPITKISDIAVNPENNEMIFISTGDRDDYKNASISAGVFRSTDGGLNWLPVNNGLVFSGFFQISKILINPSNPDVIYLSTSSGIYKTTNATTLCQWTVLSHPLVYNQYFRNILFNPEPLNSTIYASGKDIIKSVDGGVSWTSMTGPGTGLDFSTLGYPFPHRINIEISSNDPNVIYATAIFSNIPTQLEWNSTRKFYLFKFVSGSWVVYEPFPANGEPGYSYTSHGASPSWLPLAISPINLNQLNFGNVVGWRSLDGGQTYSKMYNYNGQVHADCHELKYSPDGQTLFIGCDGGFYKVTNPAGTSTFTPLNNGLTIGTIQKIGGTNLEEELMLMGEFDCGSVLYDPVMNPGTPWRTIGGGDGCEQVINYTNSDIMFSSSQKNGISRSMNRGLSFNSISRPEDPGCPNDPENAEFCADYIMHPYNPNILYANYTDLYKRTYSGNNGSWSQVSFFDDDFGLNCYDPLISIGIAPNNPQVIYVAIENMHYPNPSDFQLFKTTSGGYDNGCTEDCWSELFPPNLPCPYITSIAVSPYDENKIWISYSGYVEGEKVKMFDGNAWSDYSEGLPNMPVNNIIYENGSDDGLYAATDVGVYYINNVMDQWEPFMTNLPNVMVSELEINYQFNTIKAGTYGRGLWESPLPCTYINSNIEITSNQSWFVPMRVMSDITVKTGNTLTIENRSTVYLSQYSKIIVERGGKLIIDGGTLTSACDGLWKGIEVWGTSTQGQYPQYQGWVEVINGGTIENSLMGIYANKPSGTVEGDWEPGYTGGIIRCTEANFINNKVAAQFFGYGFTSASYFTDCVFKTNDDYIGSVNPEFFIDVTGTLQLSITNCDFLNETETQYFQSGINSFNSILIVRGICLEGDPCTSWDNGNFQNLEYGIYATASTSTKYVDIRNTDFTENYRGLYISGMTAPRVTSNKFYINEPFVTNGGYGMYLDHSTGYWVEDNDFIHEGDSIVGIGLIVHHSGTAANEVYRNRFLNLTQGISAQEQNKGTRTGLQIRCNDFDECGADILVPIVSSPGYGIASNQGSNSTLPQNMAGNLFYIPSQTPDGDFDDMNNQAASLTYYYPLNTFVSNVNPIDYTSNTVTKWGKNVLTTWSFENGCPSHIEGGGGGGGTSLLMNTIAGSDVAIEANEILLSEIIDGGNTENLDADVENSIPPEAEQVYTELMSLSPYLSETVVSTSIAKENVLPNAMIRDVMVANPHTAKSDELIEKLDERNNPMPDYMKAQVLEGRDIMTEKQSIEADIANYKLIKARAFNELTRQYLGSAENVQVSLDSLEQLYAQDNEPESKYHLAVLKLESGDHAGGSAVLEDMPVQYGLSGGDLAAYEQMTELFELVSGIYISGRNLSETDSSEVQQLALLASEGDNPANIYARNILLSSGDISYDEPVQLPDLMKSAAATEEYEKLMNAKPPRLLEVYPNPSKDFVIIGYTTGEETLPSQEGTIEIQDAAGRIIKTVSFKSKRDQVTIITKDWKSGIYIASLKLNGNIIGSVKFTLVK